MAFPTLTALLPRLEEAEQQFDAYLANLPKGVTGEDVYREAEKLNQVIREGIEAMIVDTQDVNNPDTVRSIFLPIPEGSFTHGHLGYQRFLQACQTNRMP